MTSRARRLLACIPAILGTVSLLIALLDQHTSEPSFWLGVLSLFALTILFGIKAVTSR